MCVHAPPDGEEELSQNMVNTEAGGSRRRLDNSDSDDEHCSAIQRLRHKVTMESKLNSTDFKCDPTESFRSNIANYCRRKRLPELHEIHHFNFYIWCSNKFGCGHDSIVIGSHNNHDNDYGYITAELCVDIDEEKVFPNTRYLNKYEAQPFINGERKRGWKYQFSYRTTLNSLIDLVLELIQNHGRYSNLHNGCQHFVEAFLHKIVAAEHEKRIQHKLASNTKYQRSKSQCVRGMQRYLAHNAATKEMREEGLVPKYDTMESTLQLGGTALVLPVVAMAISKETVKSHRDRVWFQCVDERQPGRDSKHSTNHNSKRDRGDGELSREGSASISLSEGMETGDGAAIKQHIL